MREWQARSRGGGWYWSHTPPAIKEEKVWLIERNELDTAMARIEILEKALKEYTYNIVAVEALSESAKLAKGE